MSAHGVVAQLVEHLHGMQGVVGSSPISSTRNLWFWLGHLMTCNTHSSVRVRSAPPEKFSMADIAQLVRALVCGTKCRRFESGYPPHYKTSHQGRFLLKKFVFCDIIRIFSGRHLVVFFIARTRGCFFMGEENANTKIFTRTDIVA